ncbi:hypothetical protein [Streptomyces sp. 142MFCol3.1]|nr:hypothetical protein [Streptomyces sp. 142MFCol3.1]
MWKALLVLTECADPHDARIAPNVRVIDGVPADHAYSERHR